MGGCSTFCGSDAAKEGVILFTWNRNKSHVQKTTQEVSYQDKAPIRVRLTNVERTLIDIAVRPVYSGGVIAVLEAFRLAKQKVSSAILLATLRKLDYVYPYHQVIGLYLERAGYDADFLDPFHRIPMHFDFYLAHNLGDTDYVKAWRLYVPKGF